MAKLIEITGKAISGEWGNDDKTGNGIPVLRTTNFTNTGIVDFSNVVTRDIQKKNISDKYLLNGDIIIEKSGGSDTQPVGRVIFFEAEENKYLFNNFTGLLRVKDKTLCFPKYLFYFLFSNYQKGGTIPFQNKTTGLHNLKTDDYVRKCEVPLPPLEIQKQIAANLDKVTHTIDLCNAILEKLDMLVKSRFVEMFGTLESPASNFEYDTLKNLCYKITDGKHGGCTFEEGTSFYFVGAREIYDYTVHYETAPEITEEEFYKDYKRCNVEVGDFLIVNTGATIGKSAIATDDRTEHTLLQKSVALMKTKKDKLLPIFLMYCYKVNDRMYKVESASAQPNLLLSKINATKIYVPSLALQQQFAAFVEQTDKSKLAVKQVLEKAETLKKALMQEYFG